MQAIFATLTLVSAFVTATIGYLSWKHRDTRIARYFTALTLSITVLSLFYAGNLLSGELAQKTTFSKLSYLSINTLPIFWVLFTTHYTGQQYLVTKKRIIALFVFPLISLAFIWTNEWHHLFWSNIELVEAFGLNVAKTELGPMYWLTVCYDYTLLFIGMGMMLQAIFRSPRLQRRQIVLLSISTLIPLISSLPFIFNVGGPFSSINLTPIAFAIAGVIIYWMITHYEILEMSTVNLPSVIKKMRDGVLIVDKMGLIVDANPAIAELMQLPIATMLDSTPEKIFEPYPDLLDAYVDLKAMESTERQVANATLNHDDREGVQFVELDFITLQSGDKEPNGELIVIHDITESRQAQIAASRRFIELRSLRNINTVISSSLELENVLKVAMESTVRYSKADAGFIGLIEGQMVRIVEVYGSYSNKGFLNEVFPMTFGITGRVMRKRKPAFVHDVHQDPDYTADIPDSQALISVPLISHDNNIGVMTIEASNKDNFTHDVYEFVKMLATNVAIAAENAQLYQISREQVLQLSNLYRQVKGLEQLKTDMIRIASHDLKAPNATIRGYLNLFELDFDQLAADHVAWIEEMIRQTERAQGIINDILSLERMESEAVYAAVDLNKLVASVAEAYQQAIKDKSQSLTIHVPEGHLNVNGDVAQLREVVANLIGNAIKYTPKNGEITVTAQKNGSIAAFEVSDTGYGIPQELQDDLFKPFYRAVHDDVQQIEGTGLGLHLVKNVIERHGGIIRFHSEHKKGSTFGFELPVL